MVTQADNTAPPTQSMATLRDYQQEAKEACYADWSRGYRDIGVFSATGTGKGTFAAEMAACEAGRVLIIVQSETLVRQISADCRRLIEFKATGEEQGEYRSHLKSKRPDIVVCTFQSMRNRLKHYKRDHFSLLIFDEGHHGISDGHQEIKKHFSQSERSLILTATPNRGDGVMLRGICQKMSYSYPADVAAKDKWLIWPTDELLIYPPVKAICPEDRWVGIGEILESQQFVEWAVPEALKQCDGFKTAWYCNSRQQARRVLELLPQSNTVYIDGKTPSGIREQYEKDFKTGHRIDNLVSVNSLLEGFDAARMERLVLLRYCGAQSVWLQIRGRLMRPFEPPKGLTVAERSIEMEAQGKDARLLDFAGNIVRHPPVSYRDPLGGKYADKKEKEVDKELKRLLIMEDGVISMEMLDHLRAEAIKNVQARSVVQQKLFDDKEGRLLLRDHVPDPYQVLGIAKTSAESIPLSECHPQAVQMADDSLVNRDGAYRLSRQEIYRLSPRERVYLHRQLSSRCIHSRPTYPQLRKLYKHGYRVWESEKWDRRAVGRKLNEISANKNERPKKDGPNPLLMKLLEMKEPSVRLNGGKR